MGIQYFGRINGRSTYIQIDSSHPMYNVQNWNPIHDYDPLEPTRHDKRQLTPKQQQDRDLDIAFALSLGMLALVVTAFTFIAHTLIMK